MPLTSQKRLFREVIHPSYSPNLDPLDHFRITGFLQAETEKLLYRWKAMVNKEGRIYPYLVHIFCLLKRNGF